MIPRGPKPVKVGFSLEPGVRVRSYNSGPYPIEVLGFWSGSRAEEKDFHEEFAGVRLTGEWFQATPEVLEAIRLRVEAHSMVEYGILHVMEQQQEGETYYEAAERLWGKPYEDRIAAFKAGLH